MGVALGFLSNTTQKKNKKKEDEEEKVVPYFKYVQEPNKSGSTIKSLWIDTSSTVDSRIP
jgi:hypothetical protein